WLIPIFWYGRNRDLKARDIYNTQPQDLSESLGARLESCWKRELEESSINKRKPLLRKAIQESFGWSFMFLGISTFLLALVVKMVQPIALTLLIRHFSRDSTSSSQQAYLYAFGIALTGLMENIMFCHTNYAARELGMRLRVACSSLIYKKIMKLSTSSLRHASGGLIMNLLSNDVVRFESVFLFLHYIWILPLQATLVVCLNWKSLGIASLAGVIAIALQTIPVQVYISKIIHALRKKVASRTDRRVLLMNEMINGIQVIKMYTWEPVFKQLIMTARRYELDVIGSVNYVKGATWSAFAYVSRTALFLTVLVHVLNGRIVTADTFFTIIVYYNTLQNTMAAFFPRALHFYAEARVSVKRIQEFLLLEDFENTVKPLGTNSDNVSVSVQKVNTSWMEESIDDTLNDVNVDITSAGFYAIVGPVGAGKSSFLKLITGELRANTGQVFIRGKISYASQEPWLFAASVRDNILFGELYCKEKYHRVTEACCLLEDFEQLPYGDRTLVGERGASLSGGQCARVNLARAVYRDADIYLLDDPLSAVDTRVGKRMFDECMNKYLKGKTRILVTHQVQLIKEVDGIILLEKGRIEYQGNYANFEKHHKYFKEINTSETPERSTEGDSSHGQIDQTPLDIPVESNRNDQTEPKETQELIAKGNMGGSLYWKFFKASRAYHLMVLLGLIFVVTQTSASGSDYWFAYWIRQESAKNRELAGIKEQIQDDVHNNLNVTDFTMKLQGNYLSSHLALTIFGVLVFGFVIGITGRNILLLKICKISNYNIHKMMIDCVLGAPMSFFDTNPSGRILNRFSKDTGAVDESLSTAFMEVSSCISAVLGVMIMVLIINWWMIFPMCIMLCLQSCINKIYLATARSVKRLEGNAKSPVLTHANSSISGLLTIRSCRAENLVCKEFDHLQNVHTATYSLVLSTITAYGFWIELLSIAFASTVTFSFITIDSQGISGEKVGLAITQVLMICGGLQHGMKMAAEMISQMIGVERLFQFTKLEQEGPFETEPGKKLPKTWPDKGEIIFDHVYLRYSEGADPVLKNLNFTVDSGIKVGIAGRTGAGKSSLISALFHLAKIEGKLYIDGVDINEIGLRDLRTKLSIIPQEPILFSASLRDNLDPFHEFEDADLWSALKDVELSDAFVSLDQSVEQSGGNFSAGQRQLLCLARAIIKKSKILVLDEATANVDPATDALIQKSIRSNFKDCTVLTIAHRLNTIMDSDKVLVMDNGEAVEYDHPHVLLSSQTSIFTSMVEQTGRSMSEHLKGVAKKAYLPSLD
ncbi:hypothetical protein QAD02_019984, partial [Eretmocerus hayati]